MFSSTSPPVPRHFRLGLNDSTLALLAATILLVSAAIWCAHGPNAEKTDFSLTYVGARIIYQGLGHNLYDLTLQKQTRDSLFEHPNPLFFEHPPFEALLFSPLAVFSFRTAYLIWGLFNAVVWLFLIYFLRPHLPWPAEDLGYVSLWLLFAPLGVALYQGQSSLVLLALYAISFVCLKHRRESLAGFVLGLGLFKFQLVLPFVLILAFRKKWRFLSGFAITSFFLFLLSVIAVSWRGLADYVRFVLTIGSNPQNESYGSAVDMPTISGLLYALFRGKIGHGSLNVAVAVASLLLLAFVAWRWRSNLLNESSDLMFAAAVAAALLTSSHMFTHDFSPLVLPMFLAGARSPERSSSSWLLRLALVLLWPFPVYFALVAWHSLYLFSLVLFLFAYSAIYRAGRLARSQPELRNIGARC